MEARSPLPASRPPQDPQTPPAPRGGSPGTEGTPEPPAFYSPRWDLAAPDWLAWLTGIGSEQPPALRLVSLLPREAQPGGGARLAGGSWLQPAIGQAWVLLGCDWWRERGGGRSKGKDRWQQAIGCRAARLRGDWLRAGGGALCGICELSCARSQPGAGALGTGTWGQGWGHGGLPEPWRGVMGRNGAATAPRARDGGWRSENGGWRTDNGGWKMKDG